MDTHSLSTALTLKSQTGIQTSLTQTLFTVMEKVMTDKPIEFWDEHPVEAPQTAKDRLMKLVEEAQEIASATKQLEDALELKKERLVDIVRVLIPDLMDELQMSEIKFEDKTKVTVGKKVKASITKANEKKAFDWLVENKFGGLIKSSLSAEFSREEIEQAREIVEELREREFDASLKESVHNATLTSFVGERLEAGETLPECFSVFEYREAKISLPKGKK